MEYISLTDLHSLNISIVGFLEFLWELAEVSCFIPGVVVEYSNKFQGVHGEGGVCGYPDRVALHVDSV